MHTAAESHTHDQKGRIRPPAIGILIVPMILFEVNPVEENLMFIDRLYFRPAAVGHLHLRQLHTPAGHLRL